MLCLTTFLWAKKKSHMHSYLNTRIWDEQNHRMCNVSPEKTWRENASWQRLRGPLSMAVKMQQARSNTAHPTHGGSHLGVVVGSPVHLTQISQTRRDEWADRFGCAGERRVCGLDRHQLWLSTHGSKGRKSSDMWETFIGPHLAANDRK